MKNAIKDKENNFMIKKKRNVLGRYNNYNTVYTYY